MSGSTRVAQGFGSVVRRLGSRLLRWRERPVLAVVLVTLYVVWGLRLLASYGSSWHSFLSSAGWFLCLCVLVVGVLSGLRNDRSE